MPIETVRSVDDERLAPFLHLHEAQAKGLFVVEGRWLVERLSASRFPLQSVLINDACVDSLPQLDPQVPVYVASKAFISEVVGFRFHRGMLACGRRQPDSATKTLEALETKQLVVVCSAVRDQENLGTILRNCAAFGVELVILDEQCCDPLSRRVLRVSMGAALHLPTARVPALDEFLGDLQEKFAFELCATVLANDAENLASAHRSEKMAFLFGNEGFGLSPSTISRCDRLLTIPMSRTTDSLNVAVTSGIVLHHFANQTSR